jgi:hypothetical protein
MLHPLMKFHPLIKVTLSAEERVVYRQLRQFFMRRDWKLGCTIAWLLSMWYFQSQLYAICSGFLFLIINLEWLSVAGGASA